MNFKNINCGTLLNSLLEIKMNMAKLHLCLEEEKLVKETKVVRETTEGQV